MGCKSYLRSLWTPMYLAPDRETLIRYSLKNLIFYIIFLVICSALILAMTPYVTYHYAKAMRKILFDVKFKQKTTDENSIVFEDISSPADLWSYLENVIAQNLYNEYWYSWTDQIEKLDEDDKKILFENKLMGVPSLRMIRVRDDSCSIHQDFKKSFKRCYGDYSTSNEDTSSFGLKKKKAWVYNKSSSWQWHVGKVDTYYSGGYYQELGQDRQSTLDIIKTLKDNLWITRHTRVVFLDFTVYNANINMFCIIKLFFEFPTTGGIITSYDVYPAVLLRYVTVENYMVLALELMFILFVLYYTVVEINTIVHYKKQYFKTWWNLIEIVILLMCYLMIAGSIFRYFYIKTRITKAHLTPNKYISYVLVAFINRHVNNMQGVMLFIFWVKLFRFFKYSNTFGQLNNTLGKCANEIAGFSIMFFVVFLAFAQMGYLLFGAYVEKFSTFGQSVMTLLLTILGEFDYYAIENTNRILAPLFFITYIFLIFFVLLNMFLAIITDTYSEVTTEKRLKKMEIEYKEFMNRALNRLCKRCCKRKEKQLEGNEMIGKIKDVLRLCNFTPLEIEAFFSMYNINDKDHISDEETRSFLENMRKVTKDRRRSQMADGKKKIHKVTIDQFVKHQEKLEQIEEQIQSMEIKVDHIIKTNKKGKNKRDRARSTLGSKRSKSAVSLMKKK